MNTGLTLSGRCKGCGKAQVRLDTDFFGHVVEIPSPCRCAYWRRIHGICRACDEPVTGKPKVAVWCDRHRALAHKWAQRKHLAKVGWRHQAEWRARNPEKARESARRYQQDELERQRRNDYKREWRRKNRDKVRAQKRRAALRRGGKTPPAIARWRSEVEAGLRTPTPAPKNERGERLCLTPGCRAVLTGRAKKCRACKMGIMPGSVAA